MDRRAERMKGKTHNAAYATAATFFEHRVRMTKSRYLFSDRSVSTVSSTAILLSWAFLVILDWWRVTRTTSITLASPRSTIVSVYRSHTDESADADVVRAKSQTPLHGHRLRTPAADTTNGQARNNSTTNLPHRNARAQHLDMSRCWDVANFCPLEVFVVTVRSRCPCSGVWL